MEEGGKNYCGTNVVEGDENLLAHATASYKNIFGPADGNAFPLDPSLWADDEKLNS